MAAAFDICDAVVTMLKAAGYTEAVLLPMPIFELRDMDTRHITVLPASESTEWASRSQRAFTYGVDIAVQQRVATDNGAMVETLVGVCEAIATTFDKQPLTGRTAAHVMGAENDPLYDVATLREKKLFMGVVRLTVREVR